MTITAININTVVGLNEFKFSFEDVGDILGTDELPCKCSSNAKLRIMTVSMQIYRPALDISLECSIFNTKLQDSRLL